MKLQISASRATIILKTEKKLFKPPNLISTRAGAYRFQQQVKNFV